jgi:chemotaxis family two-component system sensor kinase Cph1
MVQLLQNLAANALKFTAKGRVPEVEISGFKSQDQYIFCVKDNGIGISPKYFDRIFVVFQQLNTKDEYGGSGIGLAICKKIIEHHKGRIWVESEEGKGASFYFTIPA